MAASNWIKKSNGIEKNRVKQWQTQRFEQQD